MHMVPLQWNGNWTRRISPSTPKVWLWVHCQNNLTWRSSSALFTPGGHFYTVFNNAWGSCGRESWSAEQQWQLERWEVVSLVQSHVLITRSNDVFLGLLHGFKTFFSLNFGIIGNFDTYHESWQVLTSRRVEAKTWTFLAVKKDCGSCLSKHYLPEDPVRPSSNYSVRSFNWISFPPSWDYHSIYDFLIC